MLNGFSFVIVFYLFRELHTTVYTEYTFSAEFIKGAKKYCLSAHKTRQNVAGMSVKVIEQAKRKKELIVVPVFQLAWCFALILIGINKKHGNLKVR